MPYFWKYERVDARDDVTTQLPDKAKLEVYKTVSGDTGKIYYIQVLKVRHSHETGMSTYSEIQTIHICNCPEGVFKAPLSILGLGYPCKHAEHLAKFLKERKS